MSQENVEIVRAALEAWNAGDTDTLRETIDPNVIVWPVEGWPEPGPFVGRVAVLRWFDQLREAWDTDAMAPASFTDAGDRVLVRLLWRGAGQGPESNMEFTAIYMLRNGWSGGAVGVNSLPPALYPRPQGREADLSSPRLKLAAAAHAAGASVALPLTTGPRRGTTATFAVLPALSGQAAPR